MLIINKHRRSCCANPTASTTAPGVSPAPERRTGLGEHRAGRLVARGRECPGVPTWDDGRSPTCWQPVESRRAPVPCRDHALHPLGLGRVVEAQEGGLAQADGAPWGQRRGQGSAMPGGRSWCRRLGPAPRRVPGRGAGSCRQQRLRGSLKSRSAPGSTSRAQAQLGTPAGAVLPRGSWRRSRPGVAASCRQDSSYPRPRNSFSWPKAAALTGEGCWAATREEGGWGRAAGLRGAGAAVAAAAGSWEARCCRHTPLGAPARAPGEARAAPTATAQNPSPEGTHFWSTQQPRGWQSERGRADENRFTGIRLPCPSAGEGRS